MKVVLDADRCCGSGMCVVIAAEIFGQDERTGTGFVLNPTTIDADMRVIAENAMLACPVNAIQIIEADALTSGADGA